MSKMTSACDWRWYTFGSKFYCMWPDAFCFFPPLVPISFQASQDHYFIGLKILNNLVMEMNQVRHIKISGVDIRSISGIFPTEFDLVFSLKHGWEFKWVLLEKYCWCGCCYQAAQFCGIELLCSVFGSRIQLVCCVWNGHGHTFIEQSMYEMVIFVLTGQAYIRQPICTFD